MSRSKGAASIRIGFTEQRLTAHGGLAAWSAFVSETGLREQLREVLPHRPSSPNAYDPTDTALGFIGGILCGADKLTRVAHLAHDAAVAEVLGIEAVPSQSTLSRFFAGCNRAACERLSGLHAWSLRGLPEREERVWDRQRVGPAARTALRHGHFGLTLRLLRRTVEHLRAHVLPQSLLGKACSYLLNHWEPLVAHLEHGRSRLDNNLVESVTQSFGLHSLCRVGGYAEQAM